MIAASTTTIEKCLKWLSGKIIAIKKLFKTKVKNHPFENSFQLKRWKNLMLSPEISPIAIFGTPNSLFYLSRFVCIRVCAIAWIRASLLLVTVLNVSVTTPCFQKTWYSELKEATMQNLASAFPHLAFQQQNQTEKPDTQLPPEFQFLLSASLDQVSIFFLRISKPVSIKQCN